MTIPKLKRQNIIDALKFIDEKGDYKHDLSTKYVLVTQDGKKYSPNYVVAVADYLANGTEISMPNFDDVEVKSYLEGESFTIEEKQQEEFELHITSENVKSTDERFTMDDLGLGDNYKPLDVYLKKADGSIIKRSYSKGKEESPIKQCHVLLVRFSRKISFRCLWKIKRIFLYVNIR